MAVHVISAILALAPLTHGQDHIDILVYQRDGLLRIGGFDFDTSGVLESNRVFNVPLSVVQGATGAVSVNSPGWNAVRNNFQLMPPGDQALPSNSSLGFNIIPASFTGRNLSYWDGVGEAKFGAVPSGEVLQYLRPEVPSDQVVADGSSNHVPGYVIASTGPGGYVHSHLAYNIFGSASLDSKSNDAPAPGVYLVALEATVSGFQQPSNPAFVLLGNHVIDDVLKRATAAVEHIVSAPSSPSDPGNPIVAPVHSDIFITPTHGTLSVDQTIHVGNLRESDVHGDGTVWATDNPGFAGNSFQFQDEILFDVTGPLRRWDGTNWAVANIGAEQMDFVEPSPFGDPLNSVTVARTTTFAAGYSISKANTRGTIHTHYTFILRTTNGLAPAIGAYSFPLTVRSPQYSSATPVQLVFNNGLSDAAFAIAAEAYRVAHEMPLSLARRASHSLVLSWPTLDAQRYQLQTAEAPDGPWQSLGEPFSGDGQRREVVIQLDFPSALFRLERSNP